MRMSCNGCRVLRKGCSDACTIRPCLQWIKAPDAQANATVFLAKFYGRAGLLNLLAAAPSDALRPAVFRSLLYEACGRIVNPVYGSVGLLWSGQWQACQAAVEAVLRGQPVVQVDAKGPDDASAAAAAAGPPPLLGARAFDIRHVARDDDSHPEGAPRAARKRAAASSTATSSKPRPSKRASPSPSPSPAPPSVLVDDDARAPSRSRSRSHDEEESAASHDHHGHGGVEASEDTDVEAGSGSHVTQAEAEPQSYAQAVPAAEDEEQPEEAVGLELTLGLEPAVVRQQQPRSCDRTGLNLMGLRLQLPA